MIKKIKKHCFLGILCSLISTHIYTVAPNSIVTAINTGINPMGIAITPDGSFAYVANNNNYSVAGGDSVSVLNLTKNILNKTITDASFNKPYNVIMNAAGTKVYVTNSMGTTISIIDTATNTVTGTINGFDGPLTMAITPDGNKAYVNNFGAGGDATGGGAIGTANTVRIVDLNTNTIVGGPISVGIAPSALAITPNGAFVYVANFVDGTVSVIRTSDNTVINTISGFSGPRNIAITPDGTYAYVTNFGSYNFNQIGTSVSVINVNTNTITTTVNIGIQPSGMAISPDGRHVYVANFNTLYADFGNTALRPGAGTVNIIDVATNEVIPPVIGVYQSPTGVTISPNGQYAYVSHYISNIVSVIALQSFNIVMQGCKKPDALFGTQNLINYITWSASGPSLPVSYSLYHDAALTSLIGTFSATDTLEFYDYNLAPDFNTYYLVATNAVGTTSAPIFVTVTNNC